MPYPTGNPLAAHLLLRTLTPEGQVANGDRWRPVVGLSPVSHAPAIAVRAAWEPLRSGQLVPLIGEVRYAESDDGR